MQAFGSPNDITIDRSEVAAAQASYFTQGVQTAASYDVKSTDYVLSFGSALLEAWSSPVHMMRAYGEFRQGRPGRRGKLVHLEPRLSITGSSADEWIGIRPGTEGIVALGIARVMLVEDLYDHQFVHERCAGFFEGNPDGGSSPEDFWSYLDENFTLERVAAITGVEGDTLLRLAREFADARGQLAVGPKKGPLLPGALFDHLAVQMLNAMVGNIDSAGGSLLPEIVPPAGWEELPEDPISTAGLNQPRLDRVESNEQSLLRSDPERLAQEILDGPQYPLQVLLIMDADPAFASTAPDRFAQALEKIPLVVTMSSMPDDTSLLADWILPQSHFLETWDLDVAPPGIPYPLATLGQPVTEKPLHDARPAADIFLELSRQVGESVAAAMPWPNLESLIRIEVDHLFAARRGAIMGTEFDEAWVRMMERAGWWAPGYTSPEELWQRMQESGGWWDPFYEHGDWSRVFKTDSKRFEFRADLLRSLLTGKIFPTSNSVSELDSPDEVQPSDQSWLSLLLFEPLAVSGGIGSELPFLQELLDPGLEERWETWGEIHPETAARLGIKNLQRVELSTDDGAIEVRARVTSRVVVDVVAVPLGLGKRGGGRWASGRGANPLRLLSSAREKISGLQDLGSTRVRVAALDGSGPRRSGRRTS
jgi:anaerobic selenocysteine-containing dehydrogenase